VEGLGYIAEALAHARLQPRYIRAFAGEPVPREPGGAAGLIVMGGPMGVYDAHRYSFLREEMGLIAATLRQTTPVLGICLGSQLLAQVLGSNVRPSGRKEIGWFDVTLSTSARTDPVWTNAPNVFPAFHWHGDMFPLPEGAEHLASSAMTPIQAFRHGNAYGLLFHLEVTTGIARDMVGTWPEELREENLVADAIIRDTEKFIPGTAIIAKGVFGRWASDIMGSL
jgi:GMP synthase (glutamine-hydrolysing)